LHLVIPNTNKLNLMEKIVKRAPVGFYGVLIILISMMFSCKPGENVEPVQDWTTEFVGVYDVNDGQFSAVVERLDNKTITVWSSDFVGLNPLSYFECSGQDCRVMLPLESTTLAVYMDQTSAQKRTISIKPTPQGLFLDREIKFTDPSYEPKRDTLYWVRQN
jgi:hypothetical protein